MGCMHWESEVSLCPNAAGTGLISAGFRSQKANATFITEEMEDYQDAYF